MLTREMLRIHAAGYSLAIIAGLLLSAGCGRQGAGPEDAGKSGKSPTPAVAIPSQPTPMDSGLLPPPPPGPPPPLPPNLSQMRLSEPQPAPNAPPAVIPAKLGPLSLSQEGTNAQYRVRSAGDPGVNFLIPANFLAPIIRTQGMPDEQKVKAILSYPKMQASMQDPSRELGPPVKHDPVELVSEAHGRVKITVSPADSRLALFEVKGQKYSMPAHIAFGLADGQKLPDAQKIDALLRFPFLKKLE